MINREDSTLIARERRNRSADQKTAKRAARAPVETSTSLRETTKRNAHSTTSSPKRAAKGEP